MSTVLGRALTGTDNFIGYEYKNIVVPRRLAAVYSDYYPCFGWEAEDVNYNHVGNASLTFKRNRKLKNKVELDKHQRQFETSVAHISDLENSKTTRASILSFTTGLLGTAFMALATFSFLGGMVAVCIVLAIPGLLGWALAYYAYSNLTRKKSAQVAPEIDREYDRLYSTCEEAYTLLA